MVEISFKEYPDFTQEVVLDGVAYSLRFIWNDRYDYWTMDIISASGVDILNGIRLVVNFSLIDQYRAYDVPPGDFVVYNVNESNDRIEYDSFLTGKSVLAYVGQNEPV